MLILATVETQSKVLTTQVWEMVEHEDARYLIFTRTYGGDAIVIPLVDSEIDDVSPFFGSSSKKHYKGRLSLDQARVVRLANDPASGSDPDNLPLQGGD